MTDNVPDLIWAKDMEKRHLFVNQANCDKLLMCPSAKDAAGKTNLYFAELERQKGNEYTFGELCENSDESEIKSKRRERFMGSAGLCKPLYF